MKGQKCELGRKCLNGTHWEEIGQRKERRKEGESRGSAEMKDSFEKREEDENRDELKIWMEKERGGLLTRSPLFSPLSLSLMGLCSHRSLSDDTLNLLTK